MEKPIPTAALIQPASAPASIQDITVLLVNYKTLEYTRRCIESLRQYYAEIPLLLIDNGSQDASTTYLESVVQNDRWANLVCNPTNLFHGPALDQGIRLAQTHYVFTLDSDCIIYTAGFLEKMKTYFSISNCYAVGEMHPKNHFGYKAGPRLLGHIPYIQPSAMLLDKDKYLRLSPFIHHGSPCLQNMKMAAQKGYQVFDFPIEYYIFHHGAGTCSKYGYGLGIKTFLQHWISRLATGGFPEDLPRRPSNK